MNTVSRVLALWLLSIAAILAVSWAADAGPDSKTSSTAADEGDVLIEAALDEDTSDLPAIRDRGYIRFAIAPDPLLIAYDGEKALGAAVEIGQELEKHLRKTRTKKGPPTVVVPVPTPRARIEESLAEGRSDFTALTGDDGEAIAFTAPLFTDVKDVIIHGADIKVSSFDDFTEIPIYVQDGSRYVDDIQRLNEAREAEGKEPIQVRYIDGRLGDYDLMEFVEIGLIPATVMADYKAAVWSKVYTTARIRDDLPLGEPSDIAWAVRALNPELKQALDDFVGKVAKGTLVGNMLFDKYFSSADWVENLDRDEARGRIAKVDPVIRKYSEKFGFDPELVLAQAFQESKLDQNARSHVGAIGVMQVMPSTARDRAVGIPDISGLDNNVHAGVKYLRWLRDEWFDDPAIDPLDQTLLAFAAYNAGPGGVSKARKRAEKMGLDPNVWFENVEVAIARAVSREPVIYVRNIFKYYVSYRLMRELEAERDEARDVLSEVAAEAADLPLEDRVEALDETEIVSETSGADEEPQVSMGAAEEACGPFCQLQESVSDLLR